MVGAFPYRAVLFDLDGTLYRGDEAIPGAAETDRALRSRGVLVRYVTNNATLEREAFVAKLNGMGFPAGAHEIVSSATGTAAYLKDAALESAFVVGMPGLVATLRKAGIGVVNAGADGAVVPQGESAQAVVVALCRTFTYDLLEGAMTEIAGGARFVATNPDKTIPLGGGHDAPGAGSLVAAVQACTGVEPTVVGKPKPFLIETILREAGLKPEEALVVGDRDDTDLAAGRAAGCPTYLVLTGVERRIPPGQAGGKSVADLLSDR